MDRSLVLELAGGEWIKNHRNLLIIGPTGVGKTFLAREVGKASHLLASWAKMDLLLLDLCEAFSYVEYRPLILFI